VVAVAQPTERDRVADAVVVLEFRLQLPLLEVEVVEALLKPE
jgi:hypothetical protein